MRFYKRKISTFIFTFLLVSAFSFAGTANFDENKDRADIPAKYKWNLDDIYRDWQAWEKDLVLLKEKIKEFRELKSISLQNPGQLLALLKKKEALESLGYRLYYYPMIKRHTNMLDMEAAKRFGQIAASYAEMESAVNWVTPAIIKIPKNKMEKWLKDNRDLNLYSFYILDQYRLREHVLDDEKEALLTKFNRFKQTPFAIYRELFSTDHTPPSFKLSNGKEIKLTRAELKKILGNKTDREQRKAAYETFWSPYKKRINTYAAVFNAVCQRDIAFSRARNYGSTLEYHLHEKNVPVKVYENLVETVKANPAPLRRWAKLRAKLFGLDKLRSWDTGLTLEESPMQCGYEQGTAMIYKALKPMGPWYISQVKKVVSQRWIDVYPCKAKTPLTYNINFPGIHPYILMKYDNRLNSVSVLAHELGHAVHSVLINEKQPFLYRGPTGLVLETASTLNQHLLTDYLLKTVKDKKQRAAVLWWAINDHARFIYYGAMMADFELQVHRAAEKGKPITAKTLNAMYRELHIDYYGDTFAPDDYSDIAWAPMSIYYQLPFYTYQYPISFAVSNKLYHDITTGPPAERKKALKRCMDLLKAGGSNYSTTLLKSANTDITRPETIKAAITRMDSLITQLEKELR